MYFNWSKEKQRHKGLYSIAGGHTPSLKGRGLAVMLWFFNCVLAIVHILPEKTMEGQVKNPG